MQGTISSLVGAVWDVGVTDPVEKLRHEAIQRVSHDDLSASDNLLIITLFAWYYVAIQTYIALVEFDLRKDWLWEMRDKLQAASTTSIDGVYCQGKSARRW